MSRPRATVLVKVFESSSSRALHVNTSDGEYVVKVVNNPEGPRVLVNDWLGTRLAQLISMPTPDPAIVDIPPAMVVELQPGIAAATGPAFGSRFERGESWGGASSLKSLANPAAVSRLVVLDSWILNVDRYSTDASGRVRRNDDNLWLSTADAEPGKFILKALDHGHCLGGPTRSLPFLRGIDNIKRRQVFGLFPEFPLLDLRVVEETLRTIGEIPRSTVVEVLGYVPREWELGADELDALADFVVNRGKYLQEELPGMLTAQLSMEWRDER